MKLETKCYTPPPLFFVYDPVSTYVYIISHQCYASESDFKENIGIQNI